MSVQNPRNFPIKKYSKLEIMLNPVEILYPEISNIARLCQHLWIFSSFMALYFAYVEISCFFWKLQFVHEMKTLQPETVKNVSAYLGANM